MPPTTPSVLSSSKKVEMHKVPLPALGSCGPSEAFFPRKIIEGFKDDAQKRINSIPFSRFRNHLTPKEVLRIDVDDDNHDDDQCKLVDDYNNQTKATTRETKHVLEKRVKRRRSARKHSDTSKLLRFIAACNRYRATCMKENEIRMLRMVEKPVEPLEPSKNLGKLLEALHVSEHKNTEGRVALRSKIREEICVKEKERRDQLVRMLLMKLRSRLSMFPSSSREVMKQEEEERTL